MGNGLYIVDFTPKFHDGKGSMLLTITAKEQAIKLASLGVKKDQIGYLLGLSRLEISRLESEYPEIAEAIQIGSATGVQAIGQAIMTKVQAGEASVSDMLKAMAMIGGRDYAEAPQTQVNNVMILPTAREAIEALMADPALDGDDLKRLTAGVNHE